MALYQRAVGGWPKNVDMARPLSPPERERLSAQRGQEDATLDNGATWSQLRFLARVLAAGGPESLRQPFLDGLDYLLRAQYPHGGWPQFFPLRRDYSRHVTFNDGATGRRAAPGARWWRRATRPSPSWTGRVEGRPARPPGAAWRSSCAHKCAGRATSSAGAPSTTRVTLAPCAARAYELPSLASKETVEIVELLMEVEAPGPDVVAAVEGAVAWLRAVRLDSQRVERAMPAPGLPGGTDVVVRADPGAPPPWARFYDLVTNRPLFVGRDGLPRASLAEVEHEDGGA